MQRTNVKRRNRVTGQAYNSLITYITLNDWVSVLLRKDFLLSLVQQGGKLVKCGKSAVGRVARVAYSSGRNGTQNVSVGLLKLTSWKCINKRISSLNIWIERMSLLRSICVCAIFKMRCAIWLGLELGLGLG